MPTTSSTSSPLTITVPDTSLLSALDHGQGGYQTLLWTLTGPPPTAAPDIVVLPYQSDPRLTLALRDVTCRLVQTQTIGYDDVATLLPAGMVLANARSVHESSTAELALALILSSIRRIPDYVRDGIREHWGQRPTDSLSGKTVAILGYGGVGKAIADRLDVFETRILRFARTARPDAAQPVYSIADVGGHLPSIDIVVLAVPLTAETTGLVDEHFLTALPDNALIVNVSRGAVVDTGALVRHTRAGRIRAALDVVDPEPLPPGHALWAEDGVLITPHVGGATSSMQARMVALIQRQAAALAAGEQPENVVLRS